MTSSSSVASITCRLKPMPNTGPSPKIFQNLHPRRTDRAQHDPAGHDRHDGISKRARSRKPLQWYNTALVLGSAARGYSSGQALEALERAANEVLLPQGYDIDWSNISFQERRVGSQSNVVFLIGLLMVFLVLAAQFESWAVPFAVILAVPFAIFGALSAVWLRGFSNDIYFQIGMVTLIGLSAKNAILIVEFANTRYEAGMPLIDAAIEAASCASVPSS